MIRKIHRRSFARIVAMLALTGWLAGCGFKGPLYLPPPKPTTEAPVTIALCLNVQANTPIPTATT